MVDLEQTPAAVQRTVIDIGGAELEVFLGGSSDPVAPTICTAHPASAFAEGTVTLLAGMVPARVVCINVRGIGLSSPVADLGATMYDDMVDDIESVRRRLGIGRWTFWGMSGGGWLAQVYAHRHPTALASIVVESACACFRQRLADPACMLSPFFPAWRERLQAAGLLSETAHDDPSPDDTEWIDVEGVGRVFRRHDGPALLVSPMPLEPGMARAMPILWTFDSRGWLSTVRVPTLVLCGSDDPIVPVAHSHAVHQAIAGSRFVVVEGASHVPTVQGRPEAAEAVRGLVLPS